MISEVLKSRIPPKNPSEYKYLQDFIRLLMEALDRGELSIAVNEQTICRELNTKGGAAKHLKALQNSGWIEGDNSPMVFHDNRLSWRRWHEEMHSVIDNLKSRSHKTPFYSLNNKQTIISEDYSTLNSEQISAVKAIANNNLILLSGGPGTGKTSTIIQMLIKALLIKCDLKIGLAAPTGKATRRLEEAIQKAGLSLKSNLKINLSRIPCLTLHRWLQAIESGFLKCKTNPLQLDILIVDEMSMVDLSLMHGLLNALPEESQLILVGDPDQLPPIGEGAVWHTLHEKDTLNRFNHCSIHLTKLYRNKGVLADLAISARGNELSTFLNNLINLPPSTKLKVISSTKESIPLHIITTIRQHQNQLSELTKELDSIDTSNTQVPVTSTSYKYAEDLLGYLEKLIVLSPKRYGLWSVDHIHKTLLGNRLGEGVLSWPEGTPVICTRNQYDLNLANGDIGVIIGTNEKKRLLFRVNTNEGKNNLKLIHPLRVTKIDPALAITIHKSQGSEANHVICLWPNTINTKNVHKSEFMINEDYERKLIYTAITRAKARLDIAICHEDTEDNKNEVDSRTDKMID
ncbi:Exodeoxyribonuclease V alpha chain [Prochlorococcus sp. MIT 0602]|nr:Exodeoxyribonuclease V alpha chain [Prochlorococcus sp. MIT 0602]